MYGKIQESGLSEIITFICILAVRGQCPVFLTSSVPQCSQEGVGAASWLPDQSDILLHPSALQWSSVTQSCLTFCDPMNRSTSSVPVHHQLLELTQTHVHRVGDAIKPSHPLLFPSPPAPNPSQHQGHFQ